MILPVALFLVGPVTLAVVALNAAVAVRLLAGGAGRGVLRWGSQVGLGVLWALGLFAMFCDGVLRNDWLHLFWGSQIAMGALFLGSGALLCWGLGWGASWSGASPRAARDERPALGRRATAFGVVSFIALTAFTALAPLGLLHTWPDESRPERASGNPTGDLVAVAQWGFGGELPRVLEPTHEEEVERGLGHLPREVTVPLGTTLVAAWLTMAFAAIALVGLALPWPRWRAAFWLVAPPVLAVVLLSQRSDILAATEGVLDVAFFSPSSVEDSGIWTTGPVTMRTYGPVMLAGGIAVAVLLLVAGSLAAWPRRRAAPPPA